MRSIIRGAIGLAIYYWQLAQKVDDQTTFECLEACIDATLNERQASLEYIAKWHKK
jgi:hypothetical protein